jgi:hypothetical protein
MSLEKDLLEQAKSLAKREPKRPRQASLRRAISTAYYALFHLLISESVDQIIQPTSRTYAQRVFDHAAMKRICVAFTPKGTLLDSFKSKVKAPIEKELANVAATFVDMQDLRHQADYNLDRSFSRIDVDVKVASVVQAFADWAAIRKTDNARIFLMALLLERIHKER